MLDLRDRLVDGPGVGLQSRQVVLRLGRVAHRLLAVEELRHQVLRAADLAHGVGHEPHAPGAEHGAVLDDCGRREAAAQSGLERGMEHLLGLAQAGHVHLAEATQDAFERRTFRDFVRLGTW